MIKHDDIKDILESVRKDWPSATEKDIAFAVLCDTYSDKGMAYKLAYGRAIANAAAFYKKPQVQKLLEILQPFGVGAVSEDIVTREQNKAELIRLLKSIKDLADDKKIDMKDAVKMEADIRVKLNDKFEMEESRKQKRIIIVPQKHDIICPHTNRECTYMPDKETCMKYYHLCEAISSPMAKHDRQSNEQWEEQERK